MRIVSREFRCVDGVRKRKEKNEGKPRPRKVRAGSYREGRRRPVKRERGAMCVCVWSVYGANDEPSRERRMQEERIAKK